MSKWIDGWVDEWMDGWMESEVVSEITSCILSDGYFHSLDLLSCQNEKTKMNPSRSQTEA